jgi:hypothetical protein
MAASRIVNTTKKISFEQLTKILFCNDCKKSSPGCNPKILQIEDTFFTDDTSKIKFWLECRRPI